MSFERKDFIFIKKLGSGVSAEVHLCKLRAKGILVALKIISKSAIKSLNINHQISREIEIHCRLIHPNIIRLFAYFTDTKFLYLVLEYCANNSLYKIIYNSVKNEKIKKNNKGSNSFLNPSFNRKVKWVFQIFSFLSYIHSRHIWHRDIKLENILLTAKNDLKLADFGCCVHSVGINRTTFCGTLICKLIRFIS